VTRVVAKRWPVRLALAVALLASASGVLRAAVPDPRAPLAPGAVGVVYDRDYPFIRYSDPPEHNEIARLQKRLNDGSVKLVPAPQHGYLESVLAALGIDPDSQTLVFSKTSLQIDVITAATPRAIYFDDDTYVAWVQQSGILEIVTMDADRGPVFYTLSAADSTPQLVRETLRCLTCHDTFAEMGGGVPHFLFESTYDVQGSNLIPDAVARETTDETPIAQRWGGWYVTGKDGGAFHLGNIQPPATRTPVRIDKVRRGSLATLESLFDTSAYLRNTSDIVALLVLEHQVTVHNEIIHANYKSRMLVDRLQPGSDAATMHWTQLTPQLQSRFELMLRPLVDALLMANAAPLPRRVAGGNGYAERFQARGPTDTEGRSLRQLDLSKHVFRYPLSFLIYSEGFDALPLFVREHVYAKLAQILRQPDPGAPYSSRSAADRQAAFDILVATKPDFAREVSTSSRG
jgi:hypothetical protein